MNPPILATRAIDGNPHRSRRSDIPDARGADRRRDSLKGLCRLALGILALAPLTACASFTGRPLRPVQEEFAMQTLVIDGAGRARAPVQSATAQLTEGAPLGATATALLVHAMMDALSPQLASGKQILLFFHGGKVSAETKRMEAATLQTLIESKDPRTYPISIVWSSPAFPVYAEHLLHPDGDRAPRIVPPAILPPFVLAADFGRSIAAAPKNALRLVEQSYESGSGFVSRDSSIKRSKDLVQSRKMATMSRLVMSGSQDSERVMPIVDDIAAFERTSFSRFQRGLLGAPRLVTRFASAPILDALGTKMYAQMEARVDAAFLPIRADVYYRRVEGDTAPAGGPVRLFLDSLATRIAQSGSRSHIKIIAHSMGSLFATRVLDGWPTLPVDTVVFMAAAATVDESSRSVGGWLGRNRDHRLYNLVLHHEAERLESNGFGLIPTGTLLAWIDDYFATSTSPLQRTAGEYRNTATFLKALPEAVRGQVAIKMFGYRDPRDRLAPACYDRLSTHGDFTNIEVRFWQAGFYVPRSGTSGPACPHLLPWIHDSAANAR